MKWTLEQVSKWTEGNIVSKFKTDFDEIGTDTRKDLTGKIFIALKGDNYDAHQYLDQAVAKGATALIVHDLRPEFEILKKQVSIILVKDTLEALQSFAKAYRQSLKTQFVAITGSNGKTTTKEFTAQILSQFKKTHYNQGSFNNHWGVPMTLLQTPVDAAFAVIEMGMNHAGEIQKLVEIAEPDVVVCTMVGTAHIEFFGTREKIAEAKREIYLYSKPEVIRIFNQDQELTFDMMYPVAKKFPASRMLSFSEKNNEADVFFKIEELHMFELEISGSIAGFKGSAKIPVFGRQNLTNLMASASIAFAMGMPPEKIWEALKQCRTTWGRNQFIKTKLNVEILFDGYNANPDSMNALLENIPLLKIKGQKIGVFGQMKELGEASPEAHEKLGQKVGQCDFKAVFFIGEDHESFSKGLQQSVYQGQKTVAPAFNILLGDQLKKSLNSGDLILIKGSRGAETERFIEFCEPLDWSAKK